MMEKELLIEIKRSESDDWQYHKDMLPTRRNITSAQKQAKKLIATKKAHQVHIVIYTEDDPLFQEFYYHDGTMTKMF